MQRFFGPPPCTFGQPLSDDGIKRQFQHNIRTMRAQVAILLGKLTENPDVAMELDNAISVGKIPDLGASTTEGCIEQLMRQHSELTVAGESLDKLIKKTRPVEDATGSDESLLREEKIGMAQAKREMEQFSTDTKRVLEQASTMNKTPFVIADNPILDGGPEMAFKKFGRQGTPEEDRQRWLDVQETLTKEAMARLPLPEVQDLSQNLVRANSLGQKIALADTANQEMSRLAEQDAKIKNIEASDLPNQLRQTALELEHQMQRHQVMHTLDQHASAEITNQAVAEESLLKAVKDLHGIDLSPLLIKTCLKHRT